MAFHPDFSTTRDQSSTTLGARWSSAGSHRAFIPVSLLAEPSQRQCNLPLKLVFHLILSWYSIRNE